MPLWHGEDNVTFLHVRNFQDEIVKWKIKFVKHCDRLMFNIEIENIAVYWYVKCKF